MIRRKLCLALAMYVNLPLEMLRLRVDVTAAMMLVPLVLSVLALCRRFAPPNRRENTFCAQIVREQFLRASVIQAPERRKPQLPFASRQHVVDKIPPGI